MVSPNWGRIAFVHLRDFLPSVLVLSRGEIQGFLPCFLVRLPVPSWSVATARLPPPLKCVTFNLLHGGPFSGLRGSAQDLTHRLEIATAELRRLNVDILGLQEASTSPARGNVAVQLATRLGWHAVYAPASCRFFRSPALNVLSARLLNFTEGPAIVSRFPIVAWVVEELPRPRFTAPRLLLYATLQTPWGQLAVASTHTSGSVGQHRRVAAFLRDRRCALPTILMGDFNALEDSLAMATLTHEAGFRDAFRRVHPTVAGFTCDQALYAPTPTVSQRIDYVFVLPGATAPGRICSSQVILNTSWQLPDGRSLWPSDHYGVLAEVDVFSLAVETHREE